MNFVSDNCYGATPEILAAIASIRQSPEPAYGDDDVTQRVTTRFCEIFEREVAVFPVVSGTAANALALATLVPPHGAIFCHAEAHIAVDECGAPEFFTHGAKLVAIESGDAKLTPDLIQRALGRFQKGVVHHLQPAAISLAQASERGTVYSPAEITALAKLAHAHDMNVHMDGARFANALAGLGCSPAELTWKAGVDVVSFGATKNGALAAEAVVFFKPQEARDFQYRRKKSGHLVSKMRFLSVQLEAYLKDDHWLANARRANLFARRLAEGIAQSDQIEIVHPVQANAVFASMPDALASRLRKAGVAFYSWGVPSAGRTLARLMLSFATPEEDIARLIALVRGSNAAEQRDHA
ncbi:MAG TPA: low specificity L-threonine aldolase [Rhizomicrobium sp.]|jgi:threonine aldolase|nr:low specificity L-threonine aldolase [Rhizomicrobium sp.]